MAARGTVAVRFQRYVPNLPSEHCWEWQGHVSSRGYGRFRDAKRVTAAHRIAYELAKGPIPDGLVVMHACDNRRCVNPSHLSVGTYADNNRDMMAKGRLSADLSAARLKMRSATHCRRGHEYSAENTRTARGRRECRHCARITAAHRKASGDAMPAEMVDEVEQAIAEGKARFKSAK